MSEKKFFWDLWQFLDKFLLFFAGNISQATDAKVAVYSCPFDAMTTETKGTVLLKTASELKAFSQGEENLINEVSRAVLYEGGGGGGGG